MNWLESKVERRPARAAMRTTCGRDLVVGRLRLEGLARPVGRVTLDVGCRPYDHNEVWTSLTAAEARHLAALLLAEAARADGDAR